MAHETREVPLPPHPTRRVLGGVALALLAAPRLARAATPAEINIDWATYNPGQHRAEAAGPAREGVDKDGSGALGAVRRLEQGSGVPQRRLPGFRLAAGAAALIGKINGNPIQSIYVYSRPEWTALVTEPDTPSRGRRSEGKARRGDARHGPAHLPGAGAGRAALTEHDVKLVLLQHADGRTALERGDVDAWAGLDPMMAAADQERRQAVLPQRGRPTPGAC